MKKEIPYKYFKVLMLLVWALAILGVVGTWVGFYVINAAALTFAALVGSFLTLSMIALVIILVISGREDYKTRAIWFGSAAFAHLVFFICCLVCRNTIWASKALIALPIIHTIILLGIAALGIYFWVRKKFTFKSAAEKDAHAAFGGPIDDPNAVKPAEETPPKKARDEKTGIVSL